MKIYKDDGLGDRAVCPFIGKCIDYDFDLTCVWFKEFRFLVVFGGMLNYKSKCSMKK